MQLDNCARDNKNRFLDGFLLTLISKKWFDTIEVHYLALGHSYGEVDRLCFGPLGISARYSTDFNTPDEFWELFVKRYHHNALPVKLPYLCV